MPSIMRYQKHITPEISRVMNLPEGANELCTLSNWTYVSIPDGASIPDQPEEISPSISSITLDAELRDAICKASTHVQLINERVRDHIAEQYSTSDEIKLLRTAPSPEYEIYNDFVESCRAWGREQKAALGL